MEGKLRFVHVEVSGSPEVIRAALDTFRQAVEGEPGEQWLCLAPQDSSAEIAEVAEPPAGPLTEAPEPKPKATKPRSTIGPGLVERMLRTLTQGPATVAEMAERLGMPNDNKHYQRVAYQERNGHVARREDGSFELTDKGAGRIGLKLPKPTMAPQSGIAKHVLDAIREGRTDMGQILTHKPIIDVSSDAIENAVKALVKRGLLRETASGYELTEVL